MTVDERQLLAALAPARRMHTLAVGVRAASAVHRLPAHLRQVTVTAARLHDVGYGAPLTGFHPLDGAAVLRRLDFDPVVCTLVAHHTAATYEAEARGIPAAAFTPYASAENLRAAHAIMWWADLTTAPDGQVVTVETRLAEILERYPTGSPVTAYIMAAMPLLLAAGADPRGLLTMPTAWRGERGVAGNWEYGQPGYLRPADGRSEGDGQAGT